jgi:hypothetical protein
MLKMNCKRGDKEFWHPNQKCQLCGLGSCHHLCLSCKTLTKWDQLKWYINKFDNGEIVRRQGILNIVGRGFATTVDSYINSLRKVNILERTKPGHYLKQQDIPKNLTVRLMRELSSGWKSWFIPIDMIDELQGEKRGKNC